LRRELPLGVEGSPSPELAIVSEGRKVAGQTLAWEPLRPLRFGDNSIASCDLRRQTLFEFIEQGFRDTSSRWRSGSTRSATIEPPDSSTFL
jgi:hypothetical protein